MKKYTTFINEDLTPIQPGEMGKLSIETDDGSTEEWKLVLTLEKTWKQFSDDSITLIDFNNIYAATLIENQQKISSTVGDAAWNSIEPLITDELRKATSVEDSEKIYDKLYDVFDKFEIYIDTGSINTEEIFEGSMEQQDFAVGDIIQINFEGVDRVARIDSIPTKITYIVQLEQNTTFLPKKHLIKKSTIIGAVSTITEPATQTDWNQPLKQQPSNDFVVNGNGTPGVPAPGTPFN
jgi:hypothetical protein